MDIIVGDACGVKVFLLKNKLGYPSWNPNQESPRGVMVKVLDCDLEVNLFEFVYIQIYIYIYICIYVCILYIYMYTKLYPKLFHSVGAVEYTYCTSAEG